MQDCIIAIYCICDEVSKTFGIVDDPQCKMSTAEIMTFAIVSATFYQANYQKTRLVLIALHYFSDVLSYSRLVRKINSIRESIWMMIFYALQMILRKKDSQYFIVDSLPIRAYETHKSFRARIFSGKEYHGYIASKKTYFFGIKIHMIIDENGVPIEFCFTPGSTSDIQGLKELSCDLPHGSILIGDKAYTDYSLEDDLSNILGVTLLPKRKSNLKRQNSNIQNYIISQKRNYIETVFSSIVSKMPRSIKVRSERSFHLKILLFIIAYLFSKFLR